MVMKEKKNGSTCKEVATQIKDRLGDFLSIKILTVMAISFPTIR